jgi:outer membrane protein assembly factor BamD
MHYRLITMSLLFVALVGAFAGTSLAQSAAKPPSDLSTVQRLDVMRSKLESLRRSLNSAISSMPAADKNEKARADNPREILRGLEKEVGSMLSEVNDIKSRQERAERFDTASVDRLETATAEIDTRVQSALQSTASARTANVAATPAKKKKKGKFFGLFGGGGDDKYAELTGNVVAGRDRVLFEEAAKEVRKGRHDTGRLLFTTIINTYPDSPFLPLAKLAIADSFYLEGTSSALIQAAQAYQDWLTFFPTDPLADDAMLKVAEAEMRQMGLADRDVSHARKAEQRLKALMQQYPQTKLRPEVEARLREVQENLAMHNFQIGNFYLEARYKQQKGGLKGAQSRYKEIVEKYPNFSYMDEVLFKLAHTYEQEEEPDEAAKYYSQLLRNYPNSQFAEKSREQLGIIGVPVPEADPARKDLPVPVRAGFVQKVMQEVTGRAEVSFRKDGILISKDGKEGTDLIDEALKYNGQLPEVRTPDAPVQRGNSRPTEATPGPATRNASHNGTAAPGTTPSPGSRP